MKTEIKTYIVVDSPDLDEAITKEYGFEKNEYGMGFESNPAEEWNNDSNYTINVDGENSEYDQKKVDKKEMSAGSVRAYLNDMAKRGIIQKGNYLIEVSW